MAGIEKSGSAPMQFHTTKAQLRSGRRSIEEIPDLQHAPEQPEDILFDVSDEPDATGPMEEKSLQPHHR